MISASVVAPLLVIIRTSCRNSCRYYTLLSFLFRLWLIGSVRWRSAAARGRGVPPLLPWPRASQRHCQQTLLRVSPKGFVHCPVGTTGAGRSMSIRVFPMVQLFIVNPTWAASTISGQTTWRVRGTYQPSQCEVMKLEKLQAQILHPRLQVLDCNPKP